MTPASPPPSPRSVLVTGATGFVGGRLATRLLERGWDVRAFTRVPWTGKPEVAPERRFHGALPDQIPASCMEGVESVVHCAALTGAGAETEAWAVNVEGTLALGRLAAAAGARRFVFVSSQSARADAPAAYGRTKHAAEQGLLALAGLDVVIVRPGLVIGPGGRGLYCRMRRAVERLPIVPVLGGGRALVQPIHVDDLADALARCCEGAVPAGTVLRLGDPVGLPLRDLLGLMSEVISGRRKPTIPVPIGPVLALARLAEALRLPLPVSSGSLRALRAVERMDTAPDLARLGLSLRPLPAALDESPRPMADAP